MDSKSGSSSGSYCGCRFEISLVAIVISPETDYSPAFLRVRPFGQNVNCTDEAIFDCCVGAITGNVQDSYCTAADTLKLERTHRSARTLASVSVPPLGTNSWLTLRCLPSNVSLLRGLSQCDVHTC